MAQAERGILLFLLLIFVIKKVDAKNQLEIITNYYEKFHRTPLIVLLNTVSESKKNVLRTSDDPNEGDAADVDKIIDVGKDKKRVIHYVNAILRSTGNDSDPTVIETKEKFEKALRSRCEKFLECEVKCKPKKKDKCEDRCQKIYDKKNMCNPKPQKYPVKTNREVYEYLKKNPPTKPTQKPKDSCEPSDECEKSNSCDESSDGC